MTDADDIAQLAGQLGYEIPPAIVRSRLARMLSRSDQRFLVAERAGRSVGWLHAAIMEYIEADRFVVIGGLVVDRSHRRSGIGRVLMEHAEDWAREQGCSIVRLWSHTARAGAHRFYEGLGYRNVKTQYSFIKSLDADEQALHQFIPRVGQ